jgi:hypothetical protein
MPTMQNSLDAQGAITKTMLNALDQIEQYVAQCQIGPDGKPSGSAVYMHMPIGYPVDPKMFANPWTPGGGDSSSSFNNEGTFVQPAAAPAAPGATASNGTGPAGAVYPPPTVAPDPQLEASIQNAMFTAALVDNMLEVTQNGVAVNWPDMQVSVQYYTVIEGLQPQDQTPPAQSVLDAIKAAQKLLYIQDDQGNFVGYTQLYNQYRQNQTVWTDAIGAQAAAYAQAMSNPVAGQAWPVVAETYANKVTQALNDFNSMGRQQVEAALNVIATEGQGAVTALAALAKQLYGAYSIQLAGSISANVPWSYVSPISWWDHTNKSFGIQTLTASSSSYDASGGSGTSSFANNWSKEQSSSTSASAGINFGVASASASGSHADASNAFADHSGRSSWTSYADKSSNATMTCEFFLASIERPWYLGALFDIEGWYLVGQKKNSISDGTFTTQGPEEKKILPMVPKAFLIMRNVSITADDWGDAGNAFDSAQQSAAGSGQSSSTSFGASVSYFCFNAKAQHSDQQSSGAFGATANTDASWSFNRTQNGGTLNLLGSQIIGWVGEIQPPNPSIDDPTLATAAASTNATAPATTTTTTAATTPVTVGVS